MILGTCALSEVAVSALPDAAAITVSLSAVAVAEVFATGSGTIVVTAPGVAMAEAAATARWTTVVSGTGVASGVTSTSGRGHVEMEIGAVGFAAANAWGAAVGIAQVGNVIAKARTTVMPDLTADSAVLDLVTTAVTAISADAAANSEVLPLTVNATTTVLDDVRAASQVMDE